MYQWGWFPRMCFCSRPVGVLFNSKKFAPAAAMALQCRHTFLNVEELSSVHCKVRSSSLPPERGHQRSFRSDPNVDGLLQRAGVNYKWPVELGKCSKGSRGHPEVCGRFCIRFFYGTCHKGENCEFCHLEHKESKLKLDKAQRHVLEKLSQSEVITLLLPHIEKRCTKHLLHDQMSLVLATLRRRLKSLPPVDENAVLHARGMMRILRKFSIARLLEIVQHSPAFPPGFKEHVKDSKPQQAGCRR
eukprot:symbB.v1.2.023945.t1/scaffold2232.1/size85206/2